MTTLVVFVCRLIMFEIFANAKSAFLTFLFLDKFQLWLLILGGYEWGNLWDMGLEVRLMSPDAQSGGPHYHSLHSNHGQDHSDLFFTFVKNLFLYTNFSFVLITIQEILLQNHFFQIFFSYPKVFFVSNFSPKVINIPFSSNSFPFCPHLNSILMIP